MHLVLAIAGGILIAWIVIEIAAILVYLITAPSWKKEMREKHGLHFPDKL